MRFNSFYLKYLAFSILSTPLIASPSSQDQQITMMIQMMESMGELSRLSECINLPPNKLKTIIQKSFQKCGLPDMEMDEDPEHSECMQKSAVSISGISAEKWASCEDNDEPTQDPILSKLDALYERIGEREPTQQEEFEINQLMNQMQENGVQEMSQIVNGMIAGSQGSEQNITLPIYTNAQLLIHIPAQGAIEIAEKRYETLPGASFISKSSPQEVLSYYQRALPNYKLYKPALMPQDVLIMKELPMNFDYVRDMGKAFSIPHIHIQPAGPLEQQRLNGAKTLFFIYYHPEK